MKDWIYGDFNNFRTHHPWVGGDTVKPKSVARDLFERSMTFGEFIDFYGLKHSEGAVLRYLSDVYKGLLQNVPVEAGSDELDEIVHWLGTLVRSVDSSLLDEWERLQHPEPLDAVRPDRPPVETDITTDARAFRTMVRNLAFSWIEQVARRRRPEAAVDDLDVKTDLARTGTSTTRSTSAAMPAIPPGSTTTPHPAGSSRRSMTRRATTSGVSSARSTWTRHAPRAD